MAKTHAAYEKGKLLWDSYSYNERVIRMFKNQILRLALARFKWVNLPQTCNAAYLERCLLFNSWATIGFDFDNPAIMVNGTVSGNTQPNLYDEPTQWELRAENGFVLPMCNTNGVICYDNILRCSILDEINIYARELADILITARMNRQHQKMPYVIVGDSDKELDMTNILKQVTGGEIAFIANESFRNIEVTTLDTRVEYLGDAFKLSTENTWNAVYKLLGIPNAPLKRERMLSKEIEMANAPDDLMALNPLDTRRRAAKVLNELINPLTGEPVIDPEKPVMVYWNKDLQTQKFDRLYMGFDDEVDSEGEE